MNDDKVIKVIKKYPRSNEDVMKNEVRCKQEVIENKLRVI